MFGIYDGNGGSRDYKTLIECRRYAYRAMRQFTETWKIELEIRNMWKNNNYYDAYCADIFRRGKHLTYYNDKSGLHIIKSDGSLGRALTVEECAIVSKIETHIS